jgi:hypothetical protein
VKKPRRKKIDGCVKTILSGIFTMVPMLLWGFHVANLFQIYAAVQLLWTALAWVPDLSVNRYCGTPCGGKSLVGKVPLPTRRLIEFYLQVAAAKGDRALGRGPVERLSPTVHQVQISLSFTCGGRSLVKHKWELLPSLYSILQGMVSSRPGHKTPVGPIVPEEGNVQVPIPA